MKKLFTILTLAFLILSCQSKEQKANGLNEIEYQKKQNEKLDSVQQVFNNYVYQYREATIPYNDEILINFFRSKFDTLKNKNIDSALTIIQSFRDSTVIFIELKKQNELRKEKDRQLQIAEDLRKEIIENAKWNKSKAGRIHQKHPEWSKEDCIALANGKIWIGMTYEMLVYLRGKPDDVNVSNYGNGNQYQVIWNDFEPSYFYFGEDEIVTAYN